MAVAVGHRRVHLVIEGRVQGVSFRAQATDEAQRLGLTGWVRNLLNGNVESVAEGPEDKLQAYLAWCKRGPAEASVERVGEHWEEATKEFQSFGVRK